MSVETAGARVKSDAGSEALRLALRPREAAKALGIGERKLWEITVDQTSGIPHVRFGKAIVYPIDELRRWLADQAANRGKR